MSPGAPTPSKHSKRRGILTTFRRLFRKDGQAERTPSSLAMNQVLRVKNVKGLPSLNQLQHIPKLLTRQEKWIASAALAVFLISGGILGNQFFNSQQIIVPSVGGEYTEGLIGVPQLINPLYSTGSDVDTDLTRLVYSGLLQFDDDEGLIPDLAESYEISEDQKEYTFVLRDDVKWHDGKPFRATDVIFTINAIQIPEYRSPLEVSFAGIQVEQVDERTIKFILNEPFAPFLSMLTVGILPSHLWGEINPLNASLTELNKKPIGTGPYKFEKLVKDSRGTIRSYTLRRNDDFYLGSPYIERLHFKFYPDLHAGLEALRNNNVEGLSYIPTQQVDSFGRNNQIRLASSALQQYTAVFINLKSNGAVQDLKVREALSLGTNKNAIVEEILKGHGSPIYSFILPEMVGEHPDLPRYVYDVDGARQKLQDAGWELVENSPTRVKGTSGLVINLITLDVPELVQTAELLKEQWAVIGVDLQISAVGSTDFQSTVLRNKDYDLLLSGELYGIEPDPYAFWHSSQATYPGLNLSQFGNRKADEYIEIGRNTADIEKRAEAYRSLQELVVEQVPAVFLYQPEYIFAVSKKIHNVDADNIVIPADRFGKVHQWFIRTRKIFKNKSNITEADVLPDEEIAENTEENEESEEVEMAEENIDE